MTEYVERLEFFVPGTPVPQGSHRVFGGRIVDSNPKLRAWRALVTTYAVTELHGRDGFDRDAEIFVLLDFHMPRPRTVVRRRPTVRPDADKLTRAALDSLTDSRIWFDDGQVVSVHAQKWYADDKPGARIVVGALA